MNTNTDKYKDPDDVLNYKADFAPLTNAREGARSDWLESGDALTGTPTVTISPTGQLTAGTPTLADTNTSIVVQLSGGAVGNVYTVSFKCATTSGQTVERSMRVIVKQL